MPWIVEKVFRSSPWRSWKWRKEHPLCRDGILLQTFNQLKITETASILRYPERRKWFQESFPRRTFSQQAAYQHKRRFLYVAVEHVRKSLWVTSLWEIILCFIKGLQICEVLPFEGNKVKNDVLIAYLLLFWEMRPLCGFCFFLLLPCPLFCALLALLRTLALTISTHLEWEKAGVRKTTSTKIYISIKSVKRMWSMSKASWHVYFGQFS